MIPAIEFEQNRRGTRTSLISSRDHSVSTTTMIKSEPVNMTGKPHQPSIAAFKCEYCPLEFSLKEHLVNHVADIHGQTNEKRELNTSRPMEVHAVSITDTYPRQSVFKCGYCPLEFSLKRTFGEACCRYTWANQRKTQSTYGSSNSQFV
eukprot:610297_1